MQRTKGRKLETQAAFLLMNTPKVCHYYILVNHKAAEVQAWG